MRSFYLAIAILLCVPRSSWASWEVAVIFLGKEHISKEVQFDMDRNMVELAGSKPSSDFRLSVMREFPDRSVEYFVDPKSNQLHDWRALFYSDSVPKILVPGVLASSKGVSLPWWHDDDRMGKFFESAFVNPSAHRMVIVYGHGLAYEGLKGIRLSEIKKQLEKTLPNRNPMGKEKALDVLWFNACYMASIEASMELSGIADFIMASEEAEYSSGAPFSALSLLGEGEVSPVSAVKELAKSYIESYSLVKNGTQSKEVILSPATISVIDTKQLGRLMDAIEYIVNDLKPLSVEQKQVIRRSKTRVSIRMSQLEQLIDLGSFLRYLASRKDLFGVQGAYDRLESLLYVLELQEKHRTVSAPRVLLSPPYPGARLIFGYEGWKKGFDGDVETAVFFPKELKFDSYVSGPKGKLWPSKVIHRSVSIAPFSRGLSEFNYLFIDEKTGNPLGLPQSVQDNGVDYAWFEAQVEGNPIRYLGYTQSIGKASEKYTGLNVLDPTSEIVSPTYSFLEFSKRTHWEELVH